MPKQSAGILPHRLCDGRLEVFLVHPGGPLWERRDAGAWSIAKGEPNPGEDLLAAARREFQEETSLALPADAAAFVPLGSLRQPSGKVVHAWAVACDLDAAQARSNPFTMEWPRGSGTMREFPEVDRAAWFGLEEARVKLLQGQAGFLDRLTDLRNRDSGDFGEAANP